MPNNEREGGGSVAWGPMGGLMLENFIQSGTKVCTVVHLGSKTKKTSLTFVFSLKGPFF